MNFDVSVHAQITPFDAFQMKPFSCILIHNGKSSKSTSNSESNNYDLICSSNDGRVFIFDGKNYTTKRSIMLHASWISTMCISEKYFASASFDTTVAVTTVNELFDLENIPNFVRFNEHTDYVLAVAIANEDTLITSSSEPRILISTISGTTIQSYRSINLVNSAHCLALFNIANSNFASGNFNNQSDKNLQNIQTENKSKTQNKYLLTEKTNVQSNILFGTNNGKLIHYELESGEQKEIYLYDSAAKVISFNCPQAAIGFLDGSVFIVDVSNNFSIIETHKYDSKIVSIFPRAQKFVVFTSEGNIYDMNENGFGQIEIRKHILYGISSNCSKFFHIAANDNALFCINMENEIVRKINGGKSYVKAVRIPQSTSFLCKTAQKEVSLWNLETFEQEKNFGVTKLSTILNQLSKKPTLYFPLSFDVSSGSVRLVIPPILPKLCLDSMSTQRKEITKLIKRIIEKKILITAFDNKGKAIWTNFANESVPYWFRYLLDPKFNNAQQV
ncbi:hypothetical protein TRFO_34478 [Tritrichomonas foetus]|uniref:Uncharacterized protein n=1 Tax=Tritrichomonas foetus TaxID=1144522 RepID=A0A1J4JL70_9EUKA|nr:hypothetical protein TRFO_34478 [Tritrichomonas foetus]|eukprot:OHS99159.1 hypothetical protein TRFO_34478 [Tritrichomonas foetus]